MDILDPQFQQHLESLRGTLKQEIQRELRIKEAAERMRGAVSSRRGAAEVEGQLKASSRKLDLLHRRLQDLNAQTMAPDRDTPTGGSAGGRTAVVPHTL